MDVGNDDTHNNVPVLTMLTVTIRQLSCYDHDDGNG